MVSTIRSFQEPTKLWAANGSVFSALKADPSHFSHLVQMAEASGGDQRSGEEDEVVGGVDQRTGGY